MTSKEYKEISSLELSSLIVVTGGAGFIGSNLVYALNERGYKNIIVVDDLRNGHKFQNIVDCDIADYLDFREFREAIEGNGYAEAQVIFHQGACSDTTEWDGQYMLDNNYAYSKSLLQHSIANGIQFIYASSAAVYGSSKTFTESAEFERPLNVYGYSKLLFDRYVRRNVDLSDASTQVLGLRYFNVYGPREQHKEKMASVAWHLKNQLQQGDSVCLFEGSGGYEAGEQRRDFIYVGDIVKLNLWFMEHPELSGIYNAGTGRSQTFNDVANAVLDYYKRGTIEYIPFPEGLREAYQSFTEADISNLRALGYQDDFKTVEEGVSAYMRWINR